jgi:Uma2 family endonuclease
MTFSRGFFFLCTPSGRNRAMNLIPPRPTSPIYPESDGKPMADNTKQCRWIFVLFGNIAALFRDMLDVFVAADLFWYPVEGDLDEVTVPDVLVVFGRPKGDRGSYKQWEEDNVPVIVAFEVLSPSNTYMEMTDKHLFYEDHGVEEYYVYDPDANRLNVYLRKGDMLRPVRPVNGFVSPRLGIRFDLTGPEMVVFGPDRNRFLSFEELTALLEQSQRRAARMAELGRKARRQQATPEELQELERLEDEVSHRDGGIDRLVSAPGIAHNPSSCTQGGTPHERDGPPRRGNRLSRPPGPPARRQLSPGR